MKVLLLDFSGTGHTTLCGNYIQASFQNKGHEVTHYSFKHDRSLAEDINDYNLIGIGYPIHAFNVPEAFNRFLKNLPAANKPFFIYKVSGEPFHFNDSSSYHFVKKLKKKGYTLVGEKHFLMPYNIMFRYKDGLAKQMYLYLGALCEAYVLGLLANEAETIPYRFGHKALSFLLRIEWIAPKLNSPFIHVKKSCTSCGKCLRECPTGAIIKKGNGKLSFKASRCAMCMRCAFFCPTNSIVYGFMNPWKVNSPYRYEALAKDDSVDPHFVSEDTKGYFKKFLPYFKRQDALLEKYGIENPLK